MSEETEDTTTNNLGDGSDSTVLPSGGSNYVPTTPELYSEDAKTFTVLGPDPDNPGQSKTMTYPKDFSNPAIEKLYNMSNESASKNSTVTPEASAANMDSGNPPPVSQPQVNPPANNQPENGGQSFGVMRSDINQPNGGQGGGITPTAPFKSGGVKDLTPYETETSTSTKHMSPETRAGVADVHQKNVDLITSTKEAITAQNKVNASAANLHAETMQNQVNEIHMFRQQVDTEVQKRMNSYDNETRKLSEMKIDPNHAFGDGVTPSKILAGIGLAMGAIGQAHGGGPNMAIGIIQDAIKRDIEVQKANMEHQRGVVEATRGGLDAYVKVADTKETAMALEHKRINDWTNAKIAQMQAGTADSNMKMQLAQLSAGMAQENVKLMAQITGSTTTTATKSMMPSMMGKADASVNKEITGSEAMGQRFHAAADEIDTAMKNGGVAASGTFRKWFNEIARTVGQDNPDVTAFKEKVENLFVDQAVKSGLTRKEGLEKFEKITGRGNDSPETLSKLLRQEGDKEVNTAAMQRQQHQGQLKLPNELGPRQGDYSNLNAKRNSKVGH